MKNPVNSRFFQRPATKTGWWAGGLAILGGLMLGINMLGLNPFDPIGNEETTIMVPLYDVIMFSSMISAIVLGVISLTRKRERSWLVWLFLIPMLALAIASLFLIFERVTYPKEVEEAPTPDAIIAQKAVIFDDDGSPDGTSALMYLLSDPHSKAMMVSVSYGEAHPQVYIQYLGGILEQNGYGNIPLGAGNDAPLAGDNSFPEHVRIASNEFWGFTQADPDQVYPVQDSADLMIKTIMESSEPVTIFISGSLTNLAQALRKEPAIKGKVAGVFIMGGAVYAPGNLHDLLSDTKNTVAEWNIYVDPLAASEVFNSGLTMFLIPLDATNQVKISREDTIKWRKGGRIPDFAADIYDSLMASWNEDETEMWDLMTAVIMMNPEHCAFTPLMLEVVTAEGDFQGQTKLVNGDANVNVCLEPKRDEIKKMLSEVFGSRK